MPNRAIHPVIYTDLDGTLLDHDSYSAEPADQLVRQLRDQSLADVVLITSKTRAELQDLKRKLGLDDMISVTENGSVMHLPTGYPFTQDDQPTSRISGHSYADIRDQIALLPPELRCLLNGFDSMSAETVAQITGLPIEDARAAKQREASEPFLWSGTDAQLATLQASLSDSAIRIQRGGRFYHLTGHATKEQAMRDITDALVARMPETKIVSIALGDGPNDLAMIEAADFGVIIPNPNGVTITSAEPHVRTARAPGPQGWAVVVQEILSELGCDLRKSASHSTGL